MFSRFYDIETAPHSIAPILKWKKYFLSRPLQKSIFKKKANSKNFIPKKSIFYLIDFINH